MRVLVIDQFDICRIGMREVFLQMDPACEFLEADSIENALSATQDVDLDMIIVDMEVSDVDSDGMLNKIQASRFRDNIVLFSTHEDYYIMRKAYEMGISAFIKKQTNKQIIISVFQIVLAGGKYFSPDVIGGKPSYNEQKIKAKPVTLDNQPILSQRQLEVLELLSEGKPNKVIARELDIATGTVKVHIAGILKALKAKNRTQAVSIAQHINLI